MQVSIEGNTFALHIRVLFWYIGNYNEVQSTPQTYIRVIYNIRIKQIETIEFIYLYFIIIVFSNILSFNKIGINLQIRAKSDIDFRLIFQRRKCIVHRDVSTCLLYCELTFQKCITIHALHDLLTALLSIGSLNLFGFRKKRIAADSMTAFIFSSPIHIFY